MIRKLELSRQIRSALSDPSPQDSVERVKDTVAKELGEFDKSANIKSTNYFNHTYAPDFVMKWSDNSERNVFLRMTEDVDWFTEDVLLLDSQSPLVIDLADRAEGTNLNVLKSAISSQGTMVSAPEAIEELILHKKEDSTAGMVTNALAQGGKGLFLDEDATQFASVISAGFEAASKIELESTTKAIQEITENLNNIQASRLTRVLQAVWEGNDGAVELFPGERDLSGKLNLDSLRYLLNFVESETNEFWKRIGRGVSLRDLTELGLELPHRNVTKLIKANLDVIQAPACAVFEKPLSIENEPQTQGLEWSLRNSFLSLESKKFFVVFGESKDELEPILSAKNKTPSIESFIERAESETLDEVSLRTGAEIITLQNEEGSIVGQRLFEVAGERVASTFVERAKISSPTGKVTVDFTTATGTRQTRSNLLMADLLKATVPLILPLDDSESTDLSSLLYIEDAVTDATQIPLISDEFFN